MKVRNTGDITRVMQSIPAGVVVAFKPREVVEVDCGFDYLKNTAGFVVVEEAASPAQSPASPATGTEDKK